MKAAEGPCDHVMFLSNATASLLAVFRLLGFGSGVDSSLYFRGFYIGSASLKTSPPGRSTPVRKTVQTLECEKVEKKKRAYLGMWMPPLILQGSSLHSNVKSS